MVERHSRDRRLALTSSDRAAVDDQRGTTHLAAAPAQSGFSRRTVLQGAGRGICAANNTMVAWSYERTGLTTIRRLDMTGAGMGVDRGIGLASAAIRAAG